MSIFDNKIENFMEMEKLERAKDSGRWLFWQLTKDTFAKRKSSGYWRFPLYVVQQNERQLADLLIVDRDEGIIVIDVYEQLLTIEEMTKAQQKIKAHVLAVRKLANRDPRLANKIHGKGLIALPKVSAMQWQGESCNIILQEDLSQYRLLQKIHTTPYITKGDRLNDDRFKLMQALLSGVRMRPTETKPTKKGTRLEIIYELSKQAKAVDLKQDALGKVIPPGQQRIRGIAGTGKTAVQCQKAAHMHLKHPEWHIGFVYYSENNYEVLIEQIDYWLRYFSNDTVNFEKAKSHIHVHSFFGSEKEQGFFPLICREHNYTPPPESLLQKQQHITARSDLIGALCTDFLKNVYIVTQLYDALLIDEGECFIAGEDYRYEDKQSFYWLAYQLTQPLDGEKVNRRLIWAYDESTDLTKMLTPTAREMFGDDAIFRHFVTGMHKGGLLKSDIMLKCYRTPGPIITAAHTIGMGLLRKQGMLAGVTTKEAWQHLGYDVLKGVFQEGEQIVLHRPPAHSPNIVPKMWPEPVLTFSVYDNREAELDALANALHYNEAEDELNMTRHVLVLTLGEDQAFQQQVAIALQQRGIETFVPNAITPQMNATEISNFTKRGAVTVSTVSRARGHEAYMVYIVGLEKIAQAEDDFMLRNELFMALMRTQGWCHLSGLGEGDFYDELKEAMQSGNTISFTFKKAR